MPKYLCPIVTCNVSFEGSINDIIPPAIGHAGGSHEINLSEENVIGIIRNQANNPNYLEERAKLAQQIRERDTHVEPPKEFTGVKISRRMKPKVVKPRVVKPSKVQSVLSVLGLKPKPTIQDSDEVKDWWDQKVDKEESK